MTKLCTFTDDPRWLQNAFPARRKSPLPPSAYCLSQKIIQQQWGLCAIAHIGPAEENFAIGSIVTSGLHLMTYFYFSILPMCDLETNFFAFLLKGNGRWASTFLLPLSNSVAHCGIWKGVTPTLRCQENSYHNSPRKIPPREYTIWGVPSFVIFCYVFLVSCEGLLGH